MSINLIFLTTNNTILVLKHAAHLNVRDIEATDIFDWVGRRVRMTGDPGEEVKWGEPWRQMEWAMTSAAVSPWLGFKVVPCSMSRGYITTTHHWRNALTISLFALIPLSNRFLFEIKNTREKIDFDWISLKLTVFIFHSRMLVLSLTFLIQTGLN